MRAIGHKSKYFSLSYTPDWSILLSCHICLHINTQGLVQIQKSLSPSTSAPKHGSMQTVHPSLAPSASLPISSHPFLCPPALSLHVHSYKEPPLGHPSDLRCTQNLPSRKGPRKLWKEAKGCLGKQYPGCDLEGAVWDQVKSQSSDL